LIILQNIEDMSKNETIGSVKTYCLSSVKVSESYS
jgi:hypothetical protein